MPQDYNYDNFIFRIFTGRRIPFEVYALLFIVLVFIIPMMIFYEFLIGVPWYTFFYIDQDFINFLPIWWANPNPHVDWIDILTITIGTLSIMLTKGLYEKALDIKEFMIKSVKNKEKLKEYNDEIDRSLKFYFKTIPKVLLSFILLTLPILWFFLFNYNKFLLFPNETLMMSIVSTFALEIQWGLIAIFLALTLGFGLYIRRLSQIDIEINVFYPDRVGGLKCFGVATIRNLFLWTLTVSAVIFIATENLITSVIEFFFLYNVIVFSAAIIISILIFFVPLYSVHKLIIVEKGEVIQESGLKFLEEYQKLKGIPTSAQTEKNYEMLLVRLNALAWRSYYDNAKLMRDWPWDTNILYKFCFALFIPVLVGILNILVKQPFNP